MCVQLKKDNGSVIRVGIRTKENSKTPQPKSRDLLVITANRFPPLITANCFIPEMTQCLDSVSERVREGLKEGELWDNKCVSSAEANSGGLQHQNRSSM